MRLTLRGRHGPLRAKGDERGQSLVEFALVFPLFWLVLIALIEFAFLFNALLSVSAASRDAAVVAAEAADSPTADCAILHSVESDFIGPSFASQIQKVDIYWTDANGVQKSGAISTYTRTSSASMACVVGGVAFSVPYTQTAAGYPPSARCSARLGCGANHPGLDTIGVEITYQYLYKTPYGSVLGGSGMTMQRSAEMRVEPFQ